MPILVNVINCMYCRGEHVYKECHENPVFDNYVGSQPNRAYNPYPNTYNLGWTDQPNFL